MSAIRPPAARPVAAEPDLDQARLHLERAERDQSTTALRACANDLRTLLAEHERLTAELDRTVNERDRERHARLLDVVDQARLVAAARATVAAARRGREDAPGYVTAELSRRGLLPEADEGPDAVLAHAWCPAEPAPGTR